MATGDTVSVPGKSHEYGWTPSGNLFKVAEDGTLLTCAADTGECVASDPEVEVIPGSLEDPKFTDYLVLGGVTYES